MLPVSLAYFLMARPHPVIYSKLSKLELPQNLSCLRLMYASFSALKALPWSPPSAQPCRWTGAGRPRCSCPPGGGISLALPVHEQAGDTMGGSASRGETVTPQPWGTTSSFHDLGNFQFLIYERQILIASAHHIRVCCGLNEITHVTNDV